MQVVIHTKFAFSRLEQYGYRNLYACLRCTGIYGFACFARHQTLVAVQEQCLPTNFIPFTIFVLFYRIVAIFKYSEYSETVKARWRDKSC